MQASRRSLARQEIDHELVWLVVSLGTFAGLAFWRAAHLPMPRCAFHSFTGFPCPTCGATRAAWQFLQGHFAASFLFNPLAFFACCVVIVFDLYALAVLVTGVPRLRLGSFSAVEMLVARSAVIILLAGNWVYLLAASPR